MTISPSTIGSINLLAEPEKREIYTRLIPQEILEKFSLPERNSTRLQSILQFNFASGSSSVEIALFHEKKFPDPVLYGHLTDTLAGYIHVLLYIVNDPNSPRFDTDRLSDGTKVSYGSSSRNIKAELAADESRVVTGPDTERSSFVETGNYGLRKICRQSWSRDVFCRPALLSQRGTFRTVRF